MEYYNNILAVESAWLVDQGIISKENYHKLALRGDIEVIRRGCRNTPALVNYENMPTRFKAQVKAKVKDPHRAAMTNMVEDRIEDNAELAAYFDSYELSDGRNLPRERRREYYANAIILDAADRLIKYRNGKRRAMGARGARFWNEIADFIQDLDRKRWPHALPANPRSLERKFKCYKAEGPESLIHRTYIHSHRNAAKIKDEAQQNILMTMISDPRNYDNEQVVRAYNVVAEQMEWKKITAGTVAVWRDKTDDILFARRKGGTAFRNEKTMQVKRRAPEYPLYFWTLDGWNVELLYQETSNGRTVYHKRPTVVVVLDACIKFPIGYAVGTHENPELINEALRDAARTTERIFGKMYRTHQIQSDRYAIKKMTPSYEAMAKISTPTRAHNAKAKIIEPWFNYLNKKYCQFAGNWSGFGVTSRKENQPNPDYLNKVKKNFPDYAGVVAQIADIIEKERAELMERYINLFNEMPEDKKIELPREQYLLQFGSTTGYNNLMRGNGLTVTIGGVKRSFDSFDFNFRKYSSTKWEIRYDPENLDNVLAVNDDETLRFMLEAKYVQPMALVERSEKDAEELARVREFNREYEKKVTNKLGELSGAIYELATSRSLDEETLSKLMITDSNGQHKNRRSETIELPGTDVFEKSTEKLERISSLPLPETGDVFDIYDEY